MEADLYSTVVQICKLATTDNERERVLEYTMFRIEVLSVEMSHFELWVCTKRHFNCNTSLTNIDHENFIADVSGVNRTAARINLLRTNRMQR